MRSQVWILGAMALVALSTACSHSVHEVHTAGFGTIPGTGPAHPIKVEAEQKVVIATGNTDFVDDAYQLLLEKCPAGEIRNIQARWSSSHNFLSYTNKMVITAVCYGTPIQS